ncbi:MAG: hypothetical protein VZQ55_02025 [Ruminococcus sp.]|nr:hypothetical protein [Ruminococcus sp.]
MFSSNQTLSISGSLTQKEVAEALQFAVNKADYSMKEAAYKIVDNKIVIGWDYNIEGWEPFPLKTFDLHIAAGIIIQFLKEKEPSLIHSFGDGSEEKGFLMKVATDDSNIEKSFYAIVSFEPYYNFYAK